MTNIPNLASVIFATPRQPGEVDLISLVRGLLAENFTEQEIVDIYDNHPLIVSSKDSNSTVQKTNLSRFWSQQLMGIPDSQSARLHLIPCGEVALWYKHFSEGVLPFCLRTNIFRKVH